MTDIVQSFLVLLSLLMLRNAIVFRVRKKAIGIASKKALAAIDQHDPDYLKFWLPVEALSYEAMMFDLTKWTFKQFYPEL